MAQLLSRSRCHTERQHLTAGRSCTSSFTGAVLTNTMTALIIDIETSFWGEESDVRKPTPGSYSNLSQMLPIFPEHFKNLTVIALAYSVTPDELRTGKKWRRLDFSVLQGLELPHLHTLESHTAIVDLGPECFKSWASVRRTSQQEIAMRGMKLIGRHGKLLSVEFGPDPQDTFGPNRWTLVCVWTLKEHQYRLMLAGLSNSARHRQWSFGPNSSYR